MSKVALNMLSSKGSHSLQVLRFTGDQSLMNILCEGLFLSIGVEDAWA